MSDVDMASLGELLSKLAGQELAQRMVRQALGAMTEAEHRAIVEKVVGDITQDRMSWEVRNVVEGIVRGMCEAELAEGTAAREQLRLAVSDAVSEVAPAIVEKVVKDNVGSLLRDFGKRFAAAMENGP